VWLVAPSQAEDAYESLAIGTNTLKNVRVIQASPVDLLVGHEDGFKRVKLQALRGAFARRSRTAVRLRFAHTQSFQQHLQGTETRQRRLQQVETDERGEPQPVRTVESGKHKARENERAGEEADAVL